MLFYLPLNTIRSAVLRELLITVSIAVTVYFGVTSTVQNAEVFGYSMEPNLHFGERVVINKLAYRFGGTPQRGDVVVFVPPEQLAENRDYVKRVIGLPGEQVETKNGRIYIHKPDGEVLLLGESEYLVEPTVGSYLSGVIPEHEYFVMGDNRDASADSRGGWTVSKGAIVGRAWVVIWPPSEWGSAPNYRPPLVAT
jgi:signal peptidase I